ncbi:hypothetical protein HYH02_014424 [Chlamydomonas schloesseri]|uniref:Threonylcarbamoyl-AMP synthase n=1 Tax=Chlamydomonas schloesseri TaxID=2026947 RepID=A0A835SJD0_9CHLO|nr:hypothetical protein HYH02_014424 [Chlamydomonas schloesseri]|eukprot:KAG2428242.1 hypothetical protein HYH02_014424 [Chlamydomonas schloesseri]
MTGTAEVPGQAASVVPGSELQGRSAATTEILTVSIDLDLEPRRGESEAAASSGLGAGAAGDAAASTSGRAGAAGLDGAQAAAAATAARLARHPAIARAAALLTGGQVVAIPTETVYGLAANALSSEAVGRVYAAKNRPPDNPLIIHVSSLAMLAALYPPGWALPPIYTQLLAERWPGPLTVLLPRSPRVPDAVTCGLPTMAVRMPAHPVALALIAACGFPLAAPSANSSGRPSPTLARHVAADLGGGAIPLILDGGPCSCGVESTVLDGLRSPPAILRPGGVTREELVGYPGLEGLQVYRKDFTDAALEAAPTTPGMKYRHYSPTAPVILLEPSGACSPAPAAATANGASGSSGSSSSSSSSGSSGSAEDLAARLRRATEALLVEMAATRASGRQGALAPSSGPTEAAPAAVAAPAAAAPQGAGPVAGGKVAAAGAPAGSVALDPPALELASQLAGGGPIGVLRTSLAGAAPGLVHRRRAAAVPAAGAAAGLGDICNGGSDGQAAAAGGPKGSAVGGDDGVIEYVLGHVSRPADVAAELFAGLRALDEAGCAVILVEGVADEGAGVAVMNRLRKAASRVVHV